MSEYLLYACVNVFACPTPTKSLLGGGVTARDQPLLMATLEHLRLSVFPKDTLTDFSLVGSGIRTSDVSGNRTNVNTHLIIICIIIMIIIGAA